MGGQLAELDRLRARRLDDDALALLEICIGAAEADARARGISPVPTYTLRAAVIHRRRRDHAAEVEVLERWTQACPGLVDEHSLIGVRLARARRLHERGFARSE